MLLSPEQEALCERVEKGVPEPGTAALIRQQAQEIDALWSEMMREELELLRSMLDERSAITEDRRKRLKPKFQAPSLSPERKAGERVACVGFTEMQNGGQRESDYSGGMQSSRR